MSIDDLEPIEFRDSPFASNEDAADSSKDLREAESYLKVCRGRKLRGW